jgi:hypothetical protein
MSSFKSIRYRYTEMLNILCIALLMFIIILCYNENSTVDSSSSTSINNSHIIQSNSQVIENSDHRVDLIPVVSEIKNIKQIQHIINTTTTTTTTNTNSSYRWISDGTPLYQVTYDEKAVLIEFYHIYLFKKASYNCII